MLRRLFTVVSGLSLLLCALVVVGWLLAAIYPREFVRPSVSVR